MHSHPKVLPVSAAVTSKEQSKYVLQSESSGVGAGGGGGGADDDTQHVGLSSPTHVACAQGRASAFEWSSQPSGQPAKVLHMACTHSQHVGMSPSLHTTLAHGVSAASGFGAIEQPPWTDGQSIVPHKAIAIVQQ